MWNPHFSTACLKPNIASVTSDYTVPASACELFSLALNLVASCAHDSQQHQKFLVVHLDHGGQGRIMPVELRGCKTLILPRDLEKLHQLSSWREVTISGCRSKSYPCKETARKVRDAVQQLDKWWTDWRNDSFYQGRTQAPKSCFTSLVFRS